MRGVDGQRIFRDGRDRRGFLRRLTIVFGELDLVCFAWALMPNHAHLVLRTAEAPLARAMARLLTGHAMQFNRRYERTGHLFQNRYKSIPIDDEAYLREAVRYVHLNPLRAGLVGSMRDLSRHPWAGHAALAGRISAPFQAVDAVLTWFDGSRSRLDAWMSAALAHATASESPHAACIDALVEVVASRLGVARVDLRPGGRGRALAAARALVAYRGCEELRLPADELAVALGMTRRGVRKAARRGLGGVALRLSPEFRMRNVP